MTAGPLAGVRVLDLSRVVAAPFASMALGELGAEVIKVERKGAGDDSRTWGPPFVDGESAYYLAVNRNKQSLECDLSDPDDQRLLRRLAVEWADVVVENFRDGTLPRYNLALDDLRRENPRLVTATIRGYPIGDSRPGYDFTVQAGSGLMSLIGPPDGEPYKVGVPVADLSSGLFLLSGVLAALLERERTGVGQHVSVSLWESQVAMHINVNQSYLVTSKPPRRLGNVHPQVAPYEVIQAADGSLAIAVGNDGQFAALAKALGRPGWATDPRFATNAGRIQHREELLTVMGEVLTSMTREEVVAVLEQHGIPVAPIRTIDEVLTSREAAMAGTVVTMKHPTIGDLDVVRLPWRFSSAEVGPRTPPPLLGEHSAEIRRRRGN